MKYVALAVLLSLILGLPTVHFQHHINLPNLDKDKITTSIDLHLTYPWYTTTTDIRLESEIKSSDREKAVFKVLYEAKKGDIVIFHLAGYGGDGQTMFQLINDIKASKAYVKMLVEGPVYSAHAFLALSGNELVMLPYSFMMFHTLSTYGFDCSTVQGIDRTVSNVEHCQRMMDTLDKQALELIFNAPVLTAEEKMQIALGHSIYVTEGDFNSRVKK